MCVCVCVCGIAKLAVGIVLERERWGIWTLSVETASNGTRNDHVRLSMTSIPTVENFSTTGFGASPIAVGEDDAELVELVELVAVAEVVVVAVAAVVLVLGRRLVVSTGR